MEDTSDCDIDDGRHLIFFIDYNSAYLELYIADVGEFMSFKRRKELSGDLVPIVLTNRYAIQRISIRLGTNVLLALLG